MEGILAMTVALCAGTCCLALAGDGVERLTGSRGTVAVLEVRALRALRFLGRSGVVDRLLRIDFVRLIVEALVARAPQGVELDERSAGSLLVCGHVVLVLLAGLLFGSPVAAVAFGMGSAGAAAGWEASRRQRERRAVSSAMPGIYRTLSVALASGQTLAQAVAYVGVHERGPAARVFSRMSLRLRCGMPTEEAVDLLAEELAVPGCDLLATALVISHRTGSPLRELLLRSAALAERQEEFERSLGVKTAQVRLSVRIVCLLPAVMLALLALISPDFQQGLLTPVGMGCVTVAALLDGVALLLVRRLMRGVL